MVELFEDRTLLSIVVSNTQDSGTNSLRAAITAADASPGSTITFAIPGPGPYVIDLTSGALPPISAATTIDGTTQAGYSPGSPVVEINGNALATGSGLDLTADGSTIKGLDIVGFTSGAGIDIGSDNDVIESDGIGIGPGGAAGPANAQGVLIAGSNNVIGGTASGDADTIAFNTGDAVDVASGIGNAIRQDLIFANGAGIVLAAGANNDQAAPNVLAVASVPDLTTIDYQVTGTVGQAYTVDFFASSTLGGPAAQFLGSVTTPPVTSSTQDFTATLTLATPVPSGQTVTATATSSSDDTSAFAASTGLAAPFLVTNTKDNVPGSEVGSLRLAILDANNSPPPSGTDDITFAIPGPAPFVISPTAVLPTIAVPVTIDGTTEAGVQLDGGAQTFDGLTLGTTAGGSTITGLDIVDFHGNAINIQSGGNSITDDLIGTDATGRAAGPGNQTGILIAGSGNTIGGTASGDADTIAFNTGDAVDVASGIGNAIRQDLIFANGAGIVLAAGANNDQAAPNVLAVASVPDLTTIDYQVTGTVGQAYTVDFFASTALGSPAAQFLGSATTTALTSSTQDFTASLTPAAAVAAGQLVTATATDAAGNTSPFAAGQGLAAPFLVTNATDQVPGSAVGSLRVAILDADHSPPPSGTDDITFAIPGPAPFVISPTAALPAITVPVTIDGTTEAGVQLDGGGRSFAGLTIGAGPGGSTIRGLTILNFDGDGIDILSDGNTIADDVIGNATGGNQTAVSISGNDNSIGGTTTGAANSIEGNTQSGIVVLTGNGNAIREDEYLGTNGPATPVQSNDIVVAAGANNNQPAPALVATQLVGSQLTVQFTDNVPSGTSVTLDVYLVNSGSSPPQRQYLGSGTATVGASPSSIVVTVPADVILSDQIIATATVAANGTSAFSANSVITTPFLVTNTQDSGPGSLRNAIMAADSSNSASTTFIFFYIPTTGPYIIDLQSALPAVTVPVSIDATTQPGYNGVPLVELDGGGGVPVGLALDGTVGISIIRGLDIAGFTDAGISIGASDVIVTGNYIGTDLTGAAPGPGDGVGITISGSNDTIGGTAAGAANTIAFNTGDGVDVESGSGNAIRQNAIFGNTGEGIFLAPGANDGQVAPSILAVASVPTLTTIDFSITPNSVTGAGTYAVDFFANSPSGVTPTLGPAYEFLGTTTVTISGTSTQDFTAMLTSSTLPLAVPADWPVILPAGTPMWSIIQAGLSGRIITATVTDVDNSTSPFAAPTPVPTSSQFPFTVSNTSDEVPGSAVGSLRVAILDANSSQQSSATPITFAIPGSAPFVISPVAALPTIAVPVTIDGTSEAGVVISGGGGQFDGLTLGVGSDRSTIEGLEILDFGQVGANTGGIGIVVQSNQDTIGGTTTGTGNTIGLNTTAGILIGSGASSAVVEGNKIGDIPAFNPTVGTVTSVPNLTTVDFTVSGIAGQSYVIDFYASAPSGGTGPQFLGSFTTPVFASTGTQGFVATFDLATPLQGTQLVTGITQQNGYGVQIVNSSDNTIGGPSDAAGNTIGFNTTAGIAVLSGSGNEMARNFYEGTNGDSTYVPASDITVAPGANNSPPAVQLLGSVFSSVSDELYVTLQFSPPFTTSASGTVSFDFYTDDDSATPPNRDFLATTGPLTVTTQPFTVTIGGLTSFNPATLLLATASFSDSSTAPSGTSAFSNEIDSTSPTVVYTTADNPTPTVIIDNQSIAGIAGSLRFAINYADQLLAGTSPSVTFAIPTTDPGYNQKDWTIAVNSLMALPPITTPMTIDGTTQPGFSGTPLVEINGSALATGSGLVLTAGDSTVKGLGIAGFTGPGAAGIAVQSAGNTVDANLIGTDAAGHKLGNTDGIDVVGSSNTIDANTIGFNTGSGVAILAVTDGASISGNVLVGNFIGTDKNGDNLGNVGANGGAGILIEASGALIRSGSASVFGNTVGGTAQGDANTIGFNGGAGVEIDAVQGAAGDIISAEDNLVEGNQIGGAEAVSSPPTAGMPVPTALPNQGPGILLTAQGTNPGLSGNTIGGAATVTGAAGSLGAAANFIWDNAGDGIEIDLSGVDPSSGLANTIQGNLVSRNQLNGVELIADLTGDMDLGEIADNDIGTDPSGTATYDPTGDSWGNVLSGVLLEQSATSAGGSAPGVAESVAGNIISGNGLSGVTVQRYAYPNSTSTGVATASVSIAGNIIGLDKSGTQAIVFNTISGSAGGVALPMGNALDGVLLDNVVGVVVGTTADSTVPNSPSNVISGNLGRGIEVRGDALSASLPSLGNTIQGNFIGTDASGKVAVQTVTSPDGTTNTYTLGNLSDGIFLFVPAATTIDDNVISNNRAAGIHAAAQSGAGTPTGPLLIAGNDIGTNVTGTSATDALHPGVALGNGSDGLFIDSITSSVVIGGTTASDANVISGNRANGIDLLDSSGTFIGSNKIGTDAAGTSGLGNSANGIFLNGSSDVSIGGQGSAAANIISGNLDDGILLANQSVNNTISGNMIGTDPSGTVAVSNSADGILLLGGAATVGATVTAGGTITGNVISGNVISGNTEYGVEIFGPGSSRNSVSGNSIGGTASGAQGPVPRGNGAVGVYLNDDGGSNVIGPANVISGNAQSGVLIFGTLSQGGHDSVQDNLIGTNASGTAVVANGGNGVFIYGTSDNAIGGNTISGNAQAGVSIFNPAATAPADDNTLSGNVIGGSAALGNQSDGVDIDSGESNTIGELGAWNTISGNAGNGIVLANISGQSPDMNTISGNAIGVGPDGASFVGRQQNGVLVEDGTGNQIGVAMGGAIPGTNVPTTPSNVISGNLAAGVQFAGTASNNAVQGDYIGVNRSGTAAASLGNTLAGVFVNNLGTSSSDETIGGSAPGAGDIIADSSGGSGVDLLGPVGDITQAGNAVQGDLIGIDRNGNPAGNGVGVIIQNSWGNTIGGPVGPVVLGPAGNVISANAQAGVELTGLFATRNTIEGNEIGTDISGTTRPGGVGPLTAVAPSTLQAYGVYINTPSPTFDPSNTQPNNQILNNVISGNLIGVDITGDGSANGTGQGVPFGRDVIAGDRIGTGPSGSSPNPNFEYGVYIDNSAGNTIGGSTPGTGNILSANGVDGVEIFGGTTQTTASPSKSNAAAARNVIIGNTIGDNAANQPGFTDSGGPLVQVPDGPTVTLGQQLYGVVIIGSSSNIIGSKAVGNTIGGDIEAGVYITRVDFNGNVYSVPTNNTLNSNTIADNGIYGVYRFESPDNAVAMRPQRHANRFRGNPINLADYIKTLNSNTQLPRLKSKFGHAKTSRGVKVARAGRHETAAGDHRRAAVSHPVRPRVPALFPDGVKPNPIAHASAARISPTGSGGSAGAGRPHGPREHEAAAHPAAMRPDADDARRHSDRAH